MYMCVHAYVCVSVYVFVYVCIREGIYIQKSKGVNKETRVGAYKHVKQATRMYYIC